MRFMTRDTMFFNKEVGTAKAHIVHDSYNRTYYIPKVKGKGDRNYRARK